MTVYETQLAAGRRRSFIGLCLLEARPPVQIIFLLRFVAGTLLGFPGPDGLWRVVTGGFAWECAVVFVYLFNGAMDVVEDSVNGSRRPIARGALPRDVALRVSYGAALLALLAGASLGFGFFAGVLAFLLLGYLYSAPPFALKRSPAGTFVVITWAGLLTYWGGFAAGGAALEPLTLLTGCVLAVAMSLWMGVVGATTKDFSDADGDAAAGRSSVATKLGETAVRRWVGVAAICLGAVFLALALTVVPQLIVSAAVTLTGALVLAGAAVSPWSRGSRSAARRPYRIFMVTQYAAHLAVALCG